MKAVITFGGQKSSANKAISYTLADRFRFSATARDISLHTVQTCSKDHPASYTADIGFKAAGA
jgi:hypothetical protein